jgi:NAD(P)-dependent dehydrogenase (short-subunit alcohol dehydrogenase family)
MLGQVGRLYGRLASTHEMRRGRCDDMQGCQFARHYARRQFESAADRRIDILVNNAGISAPTEIAFKDFQRILAVNVTALFVATQEALRYMGCGGRMYCCRCGSGRQRDARFAANESQPKLDEICIMSYAR